MIEMAIIKCDQYHTLYFCLHFCILSYRDLNTMNLIQNPPMLSHIHTNTDMNIHTTYSSVCYSFETYSFWRGLCTESQIPTQHPLYLCLILLFSMAFLCITPSCCILYVREHVQCYLRTALE